MGGMSVSHIIGLVASIIVGYTCFLLLLRLLPKRLKEQNESQKVSIVEEALKQAKVILAKNEERISEEMVIWREELESSINETKEDLKVALEDMETREEQLTHEEARIRKAEKDLKSQKQKLDLLGEELNGYEDQLKELEVQKIKVLEATADLNAAQQKDRTRVDLIERRTLENQKMLKLLDDELANTVGRLAPRNLARALARYWPQFVWPKHINHVEIEDKRLVDMLAGEDNPLIIQLKELSGTEVEIAIPSKDSVTRPSIKLAGGAGINREAARMALAEILPRGKSHWRRADQIYRKHRSILEKRAINLGRKAVEELKLENIHPEIQKLVGYLNWRTSYRQNQYYHSLEVAKLAGIIAFELGVDPIYAKRCGLLHDIGKALDYRIEGSHAVISGDYADRYGESRLICDTVMSHHNDLIVETPLAYVLKSADTLSGARPGARVNLEEGYQVRLSAIDEVVNSFPGVIKTAIMNGGREVHIEVNHKKVRDRDLQRMSSEIAKKIEENVAFPGQIKVLVSRRFEAVAVA